MPDNLNPTKEEVAVLPVRLLGMFDDHVFALDRLVDDIKQADVAHAQDTDNAADSETDYRPPSYHQQLTYGLLADAALSAAVRALGEYYRYACDQRAQVMRRLRAALVTAVLFALTVRVLWWAIEPLVPYLIGLLLIVIVLGFIYHRATRW